MNVTDNIYSTVAATDEKIKFQAKAYPETAIKIEGESKHSAEETRDKIARSFLTAQELSELKSEMESAGEVTTLPELVSFLKDSAFAKLIGENPKLLAYVAPKYVKPVENDSASSVLEQHISLIWNMSAPWSPPPL